MKDFYQCLTAIFALLCALLIILTPPAIIVCLLYTIFHFAAKHW